jgi:hypothetical protein
MAGGNSNVMAARYDNRGARVGGIFTVAATTKPEHDPDVAMDAAGNFVISYTLDYSATDQDILAKRYLASGTLAVSISVAASRKNESHSSIAAAPDGRFDIAYQYAYSPTDDDIYLRRYSASGTVLDSAATHIAASGYREQSPSVSMDNSGNAVVAYSKYAGSTSYIKARRVNGSTGGTSAEIDIGLDNAGGTVSEPVVALSRSGGPFVVAWTDFTRFAGALIDVEEISSSNMVTTSSTINSGPFKPAISIGRYGAYLLSYTKYVGGDLDDIHARRGHILELFTPLPL